MLEKCARRRDLREGMVNEHPRVNQCVFQSFDLSAWGYDNQRVFCVRQQYRMASILYRSPIYCLVYRAYLSYRTGKKLGMHRLDSLPVHGSIRAYVLLYEIV